MPPPNGTVLDVMAFNIWHGGNLDKQHTHGFEDQNKDELLGYIAHERPDVLFLVETYGLGEAIEAALNRDHSDGRVFRGVQITREAGQATDRDNLWLFTWLPVLQVYPVVSRPPVTSFHFGGARLGLPTGGHVHAFTTWIAHQDNSWAPLNQTVMESALGIDRTYTHDEIIRTDHQKRLDMIKIIVQDRLPDYVDDDAPVILGGDFNTQTHLDWTPEFADAPRHEGVVLEWPVMQLLADAGFVDTFRAAHPDAARYPGRTWPPGHSWLYAPLRLDYVLAKGDVEVLASSTRTRRLPEHRGSDLDQLYPFYSDHGAVVSRLRFDPGRSEGREPAHPPVQEPETTWWPAIPEPRPGTPVATWEITATASTAAAGYGPERAVDGEHRTYWHSRTAPGTPDAHPHHLTLDLGHKRVLTAVRYWPPMDDFRGIVLTYSYLASVDGERFEPVASGQWQRDSLPKDVTLAGIRARYLRLTIHAGVAGYSAVAELIPYE